MNIRSNQFNLEYYKEIIVSAQKAGYTFVTLREYYDLGCPPAKHFVLRHDLDRTPSSLRPMLDVEMDCLVRSTIFVRVSAPDYNLFDPRLLKVVSEADYFGFEIGLHTNFVELAEIMSVPPDLILSNEINCIRSFFPRVDSISCHRDINYMYNSLPYVEENWNKIKTNHRLHYQAYDRLFNSAMYVNEGLNPHLCWRGFTPERVIEMSNSIYMSVHPHWWHSKYANDHW